MMQRWRVTITDLSDSVVDEIIDKIEAPTAADALTIAKVRHLRWPVGLLPGEPLSRPKREITDIVAIAPEEDRRPWWISTSHTHKRTQCVLEATDKISALCGLLRTGSDDVITKILFELLQQVDL